MDRSGNATETLPELGEHRRGDWEGSMSLLLRLPALKTPDSAASIGHLHAGHADNREPKRQTAYRQITSLPLLSHELARIVNGSLASEPRRR
jgi:hypothetical protein